MSSEYIINILLVRVFFFFISLRTSDRTAENYQIGGIGKNLEYAFSTEISQESPRAKIRVAEDYLTVKELFKWNSPRGGSINVGKVHNEPVGFDFHSVYAAISIAGRIDRYVII